MYEPNNRTNGSEPWEHREQETQNREAANYGAPTEPTQSGQHTAPQQPSWYHHAASGGDQSGQSGYTGETRRPSYTDANYVPASEAPQPPRMYHQTPERPPKPKREKKGGMGAAKIVALCLVCALLGGGGGALVTAGVLQSPTVQTAAPDTTDTAKDSDTNVMEPSTTAPTTTPNSATSVSSGEVLTGAEIYDLACQQVVGITTEVTMTNFFGQQTSAAVTGSGFIVSEDGYIVTNYHVIETAYKGGYDISVMLHNGEKYTASIVGFEEDNDVAVLKIEATGLTPVTVGNSDDIRVGDAAYVVGNPLGELAYTMTTGSVSALDREIRTEDSTAAINMFQIDAAVNNGNSGGPVYNSRGEVIGIVTAKNSGTGVEGLGFAIPINDASTIVNDLIEKGYVTGKASLGVIVTDVPGSAVVYYNMPEGAYVYYVEPDSAAETAGLKAGDIVTKLGDADITSKDDLTSAKSQYRAGDTATITVFRSGEYVDITVTFDEDVPDTNTMEQGTNQ